MNESESYYNVRSRTRGIYYAITSRGIPLHRSEKYRPFYIVGSGRAGTSLLRRFLINQEVHIPPEVWSMRPVIRRFQNTRWLCTWEDRISSTAASLVRESGCEEDFKAIGVGKVVERARGISESERSLAALINCFYRTHASWKGSKTKRWGDKTPLNSFCLQKIQSVFPDARFIHLIRDGADVIKSYVEAGLQPDLIDGANRWHRSVRSVQDFQAKNPSKVMEVRYEDLVRNTKEVTKRVCGFLNIKFDNNMTQNIDEYGIKDLKDKEHHKNLFGPVSDEHVGKGRRALTETERKKLAPLVNDLLTNLGYEPL